jgi:8-oxo-dGTP pyrophosphatase MutT (NUDIX family)
MTILRRLGLYTSLAIINTAHVGRYALGKLRGEKDAHGVRILIVDERRILLVSHWYAPWAWTLPGGGVNKGETPEEAAIREASEETGLKVNSIAGEIGTYTGTLGKSDRVTFFYTGDFEGTIAMRPNLEIMARSWFDLDSLPLDEISPGNLRRIQAYRDGKRNEVGEW